MGAGEHAVDLGATTLWVAHLMSAGQCQVLDLREAGSSRGPVVDVHRIAQPAALSLNPFASSSAGEPVSRSSSAQAGTAEADVADVQRGRCRSQQLQQLCAVTAPGRRLVRL